MDVLPRKRQKASWRVVELRQAEARVPSSRDAQKKVYRQEQGNENNSIPLSSLAVGWQEIKWEKGKQKPNSRLCWPYPERTWEPVKGIKQKSDLVRSGLWQVTLVAEHRKIGGGNMAENTRQTSWGQWVFRWNTRSFTWLGSGHQTSELGGFKKHAGRF